MRKHIDTVYTWTGVSDRVHYICASLFAFLRLIFDTSMEYIFMYHVNYKQQILIFSSGHIYGQI